jgi:hypothetical protein
MRRTQAAQLIPSISMVLLANFVARFLYLFAERAGIHGGLFAKGRFPFFQVNAHVADAFDFFERLFDRPYAVLARHSFDFYRFHIFNPPLAMGNNKNPGLDRGR